MTNSSSHSPVADLSTDYVRDSYNAFLTDYKETYSYYRWQRTPVSRYHYQQSRRAFLKVLGQKKYCDAFEVGGGDGVWTELLLPHVERLTFFDISEEMVKRAKMRLGLPDRITYVCADFLNNTLPDFAFDLVLSFRNYEYFPDKEKGMSEFARIIKPGGEIIIVTKSPEYDWYGYFKHKTFHSGQISIYQLITLLKKNGFKNIRVVPSIIGKKISWPVSRVIFNGLHCVLLALPQLMMPVWLMRYVSESFLVTATKH